MFEPESPEPGKNRAHLAWLIIGLVFVCMWLID